MLVLYPQTCRGRGRATPAGAAPDRRFWDRTQLRDRLPRAPSL